MILVRKAALNDSECIATCLLLAMENIVYTFIGEEDTEKAKAFMRYFVEKENNPYSHQACWVAEDDGKVVAAVNVYDGALLHELRQPVLDYLGKFNNNFKPEDETQAGEYYIDSLGVNPNYQGRGIGTKLLKAVIDEHVRQYHQPVGLLVDEGNLNAKRLYLKIGFKPAGKKFLFGKPMEHLQIRHIHE